MTNLKTNRPDQCEKIVELITKYKLNNYMLAKELGIGFGTFCAKMKLSRHSKFTPSQKEKLTEVIKNMGVELQKLEK